MSYTDVHTLEGSLDHTVHMQKSLFWHVFQIKIEIQILIQNKTRERTWV